MSREWRLYLLDVAGAAERILRFTEGIDADSFWADEMRRDAVLHNLQIIGEAAKGIPESIRARHANIEWRKLAGLRDVLSHAYFALDRPTVWDIVANKVPKLARDMERVLDAERPK